MESKYKKRAWEILISNALVDFTDISGEPIKSGIVNKELLIKAMCQLAEEVEKEQQLNIVIDDFYKKFFEKLYTKKQVEELLAKHLNAKLNID